MSDANWPAQNGRLVFAATHDLTAVALVTQADGPGEQSGNQGPYCDVWRVSLEGEAPRRIFTWPARIHELCWVDGDQSLIVAMERGGVHHDLWEIPLKDPDRSARKLTFSQADECSPSVSVDGRFACFTDSHIHANYGYGHWYCTLEAMRLQCGGEDLTMANLMVANSDGDGVYDREFFLGRPDPLPNRLARSELTMLDQPGKGPIRTEIRIAKCFFWITHRFTET